MRYTPGLSHAQRPDKILRAISPGARDDCWITLTLTPRFSPGHPITRPQHLAPGKLKQFGETRYTLATGGVRPTRPGEYLPLTSRPRRSTSGLPRVASTPQLALLRRQLPVKPFARVIVICSYGATYGSFCVLSHSSGVRGWCGRDERGGRFGPTGAQGTFGRFTGGCSSEAPAASMLCPDYGSSTFWNPIRGEG